LQFFNPCIILPISLKSLVFIAKSNPGIAENLEKPLISILIVNFNGSRFLKVCFDSLRKCTYPKLEIILVDNASTDNSVDFVEKNYPEAKILANPKNYMFARGNNEGIKIATGKYICLLNNDVEVDPGFIEPVVKIFEQYPEVGACQSKLLEMQNRTHLEYTGACGGYIDWFGYTFLRGRIMNETEPDDGQYDESLPLFWGSGACLFLRKEALEDHEILDEDFQLHMEEIDLCWRLRLAGWVIYSIPESLIWHHGGGTLGHDNPAKIYYNFRNNIFMLAKNLSTANLIVRLPFRVFLDAVALIRSLIVFQFAMAMAIPKAYGWLLLHINTIWKKRRQVQRKRQLPDRRVLGLMYPGSIVFEFFLLGKKRFSNLFFYNKFMARINQDKIGMKHSLNAQSQ
jgi:GT2 family glycosyltransferase